MISFYELFLAMQSAYKDSPKLENWRNIYHSDGKEGLGAVFYVHETKKEALIVFRGTVPSKIENLRDDFILATQNVPKAFKAACEFDQHVRTNLLPAGYGVTYLGHSLGAIHASLLACLRHGRAILYESPGIAPLINIHPALKAGAEDPKTKIINILAAPNLINTLHPQIGISYRIYIGLAGGMSVQHIVKCVAGAVMQGTASERFKDLSPSIAAGAAALQSFLKTSAAPSSLLGKTINTADYIAWLLRQHSIDSAVAELAASLRAFSRIGKIESWPVFDMGLLAATNLEVLTGEGPEGLEALSAVKEVDILERRLQKLCGYAVKVLDGEPAIEQQRLILREFFAAKPMSAVSRPIAVDSDLKSALQMYSSNLAAEASKAFAIKSQMINRVSQGGSSMAMGGEIRVEEARGGAGAAAVVAADDAERQVSVISEGVLAELEGGQVGQAAALGSPILASTIETVDQKAAIRASARRFLGYGYDRQKKGGARVLTKVLGDFPDDDVDIVKQRHIIVQAIDASEEKAVAKISTSWGIRLGFEIEGVGIKTGVSSKDDKETQSADDTIVCSLVHLDEALCRLQKYPYLEKGNSVSGDSFVRAGLVQAGYRVMLRMKTAKRLSTSDKRMEADAGVSGVPFLDFGAKGESLQTALAGKHVVSVQMSVEGFGGYIPNARHVDNIARVVAEIERIKQDFIAKLPHLKDRNFFIDADEDAGHLEKYRALTARPKTPPVLPRPVPLVFNLYPVIQTRPKKSLAQLGREIFEGLSLQEQESLEGIDLGKMLETIEEVFPQTLRSLKRHNRSEHPVLVIGETGTGKSTYIGYQLGYKLAWMPNEEGRRRFNFVSPDQNCPVIGHHGAETKGCILYSRGGTEYIDSAGFLDTDGPEADICNIMAISLMLRRMNPTAIIMVMPSSTITNPRELLRLIEQLRQGLKDALSEEVMSSLFFLLNDHKPVAHPETGLPISSQDIFDEIEYKIADLKKERDKLVPGMPSRLYKWVKGKLSTNSSAEDQEKINQALQSTSLDEDKRSKLIELQRQIDVLDALAAWKSNIIMANLREGETRSIVDDALDNPDRDPLPAGSFTVEHMGQAGAQNPAVKFERALVAVASYFNEMMSDKNRQSTEVERIKKELAAGRESLEELEQRLASMGDEKDIADLNEKDRKQIKVNKKLIRKYEKKLKPLKDREQEITRLLAELKSDDTPCVLEGAITVDKPVAPRSFWAYADSWATQYKFTYAGKTVPILKIEKQEPKDGGHFVGEPADYADKTAYEASYLPAWFGYEADRNAAITVYVRKKDHPDTQTQVRNLNNELGKPGELGVRQQIINLDEKIAGLRSANENLKDAIEGRLGDIEKTKKLKDRYEEEKANLLQNIQAWERQLVEYEPRLAEITSNLECYRSFCDLLAKVILKLELTVSPKEFVAKTCLRFFDDFDIKGSSLTADAHAGSLGAAGAGFSIALGASRLQDRPAAGGAGYAEVEALGAEYD